MRLVVYAKILTEVVKNEYIYYLQIAPVCTHTRPHTRMCVYKNKKNSCRKAKKRWKNKTQRADESFLFINAAHAKRCVCACRCMCVCHCTLLIFWWPNTNEQQLALHYYYYYFIHFFLPLLFASLLMCVRDDTAGIRPCATATATLADILADPWP